MSLFPTGAAANGERLAIDVHAQLETDGVLVRPIGGQVYLIEEEDLERLPVSHAQSRLSALISRH